MGRANAGPLDHLPDPPTDRLGDAPQSVLLGVRTVAGPGIGEGQDSGDRCHDAGGQRRDALDRATGQWESYEEFLKGLAKESGIETPTREDLARLDRQRKKKASNQEWVNPHDPDARITKMKDGRTHLAHKAEHAVDLQTGAVLAFTLQEADQGDTTTIVENPAPAGQKVAEWI